MKENWLNENLCSFDEKTRIELSPQLVELKCNDANLQDTVTAPHYQVGRIDALGRVIMPERLPHPPIRHSGSIAEGGTMTCVDWRQKHKPKIWKIYQWKDDLGKFIKVGEDENKDEALNFARTLAGEM